MNKKNIVPRILSLEEIVKRQEMAKYGRAVSVFEQKMPRKNTIVPA